MTELFEEIRSYEITGESIYQIMALLNSFGFSLDGSSAKVIEDLVFADNIPNLKQSIKARI